MTRSLLVRCTALAAVTLLLSGCQIGAFFLSNLPKQDIPAEYEPEDRKTLVLVDDPQQAMPTVRHQGLIAQRIAQDLREQEVITDFVPPKRVSELRLNESAFASWPIDRVGREVGAEQVIYVLIEGYDLQMVKDVYRPTASARVKVIDVETERSRKRLFPEAQELGRPVTVQMHYEELGTDTQGKDREVARKLARRLAEDVGKLFYKHAPRRIGSGFEE